MAVVPRSLHNWLLGGARGKLPCKQAAPAPLPLMARLPLPLPLLLSLASCACAQVWRDISAEHLYYAGAHGAATRSLTFKSKEVPSLVAAPPLNIVKGEQGFYGLDFTWNDSIAWVWVDPAAAAPSQPLLQDELFGLQHETGALQAAAAGAGAGAGAGSSKKAAAAGSSALRRGPLLGINVSVERCELLSLAPERRGTVATGWLHSLAAPGQRGSKLAAGHAVPASGGGARADFLTLGGMHGGFLRLPLAALWGWLGHCQAPSCSYSLKHGPPAALAAELQAKGGSSSAASQAYALQVLQRLAASSPAAARLPSSFQDVALAVGKDAGVLLGDVGRSAGLAAAAAAAAAPGGDSSLTPSALQAAAEAGFSASAAAAAGAHAAAVQDLAERPSTEAVLQGLRWLGAKLFAALAPSGSALPALLTEPGSALAGASGWSCNPGSVRVTAVEWAFPDKDFLVLARLALDNDGWLWDYSRRLEESERSWDAFLQQVTSAAQARISAEGVLLRCTECLANAEAAEEGAEEELVPSPRAVKAVRSDASWIALPSGAAAPVSAGAAAVAAAAAAAGAAQPAGSAGGSASLAAARPPALPPAGDSRASFFTLVHWWPGYELGRPGVRNGPSIVSYLVSVQAPAHILQSAFGEAWVIACYMIIAGSITALHALLQCRTERRHRRNFEAAAAARAERRGRGGSSSSIEKPNPSEAETAAAAAAACGSSSSAAPSGSSSTLRRR